MIFDTLNDLLEHIREVEKDTIDISKEAHMKISNFLEKKEIELDDEITQALQYQDIVSQQLSATIYAIEIVQKNLQMFAKNSMEDEKLIDNSVAKLRKKLTLVLDEAKAKKDAFSGRIKDKKDEYEIEFF